VTFVESEFFYLFNNYLFQGEIHPERENWWEDGVLARAGTGSDSRQAPTVVSSTENAADQAMTGLIAGVV